MKRFLLAVGVVLLLCCCSALAQTHVTFTLQNSMGTLGTNRTVWITPTSRTNVSGYSLILSDRIITNSGNGTFTVSNWNAGGYVVQIKAPPSDTFFRLLVTSTNLGTITAQSITTADPLDVYPDGGTAWSAGSSDLRYLGAPTNSGTDGQTVSKTGDKTKWVTGSGSGVETVFTTNAVGAHGVLAADVGTAAYAPTNQFAATNSVINFRLFNDGRLYGPQGQISTAGTTTMGLQEAINACITATSLHTQPAGGGRIILEAGTYLCTSQVTISNRYSNPITIEGVSDAPSTIIRLRPGSTLDGILSTAPTSTGNLSLNLRNVVLAYEGIFKKRVMKLTDVQRLQCDNVYFCSWGFVTNGGLDGNVFSSYSTAHGASVVGVELGSYDFSDNPFGLAIFNNCRFADLAAGAYTSIDHTWFNKCHFLLIGGASKQSPGTNNWTAGGSFTVPDSMYALHPGIVNYSLNGDLRVDDPNIYFTYCFLLNAHQGAFGHPLIRNTTAAGLESSAWILLQYDDLNNGNAGQTVEIEAAPEPGLMANISLVAKPGTITNRYPVNVRFSKNASYVWGATTNLAIAKIAGSTAGAGYAGFDAGVSAGQNMFLGTNVLEQLDAGITVDQSTLVVSGGTDTGINGTYYLSDRMYVESSAGGSVNIFSWTNTTWAVVVNADTANSLNGGNLGAFYKLGDSFITNCFYVGQGLTLYPGYKLPVAGTYIADLSGVGTPPTVAFTYRTNLTALAGNVTSLSLTNGQNVQTATINATGNAVIGGTTYHAGAITSSNKFTVDAAHAITATNVGANKLVGTDAAGQFTNIVVGSGLTLASGQLTSSGGSQTPWIQNVDAAAWNLTNLLNIAAQSGASLGFMSPIEMRSNHRGMMLSSINIIDPIVASGQASIVLGGTSTSGNVVAGNNFIGSSTSFSQAILGGTDNTITGDGGTSATAPVNPFENTIVGGGHNRIYGTGGDSIVLGGQSNYVTGQLSAAAGFRAKAVHSGTFVWADSQNADYSSTGTDQFDIRAQGGVNIAGPLNVTGTTTLGTANVTSLTATQYVNAISLFSGPTNNYDLSKSLQHYITSTAMAITGFVGSGSTPGLQPNSRLVVSNSSAANIALSITSPIFADGTNWVGGWSATVTNGTERHFDFTASTNTGGGMVAYTNVSSEPLPSTATSAGGSPGVGATVTNILVTQTNNAISARVGGTIWVNTVSASNSVASETVLWTNTLPAASLTNQNDRLMLHAAGTITANGDTKAIAAYLGATKIFDTTGHSFGASADFWTLDIEIIRGASGTAEVINCRFVCQAANYLNVTTATQDLGTALGVKITATCDASGDAFYKSSSVQLWPAP